MAGLLALGAGEAESQSQVKLPRTQGEIRALMRETADPICPRCGVVTAVRPMREPGAGVPAHDAPPPGSDGVNSSLGTVPFGSARARSDRESLRQGPGPRYEVTVRYDDGSYGRVELGYDPKLKNGERVKVEEGSVARYP